MLVTELFYGDVVDTWDPNKLTEEVITIHLIDGLDNNEEQELLRGMFLDGGQLVDLSGVFNSCTDNP